MVRDNSTAHYGKVEQPFHSCAAPLRRSLLTLDMIQSFDDLKTAIDNFVKGEKVQETAGNLTLKDGIKLLRGGRSLFQSGDDKKLLLPR